MLADDVARSGLLALPDGREVGAALHAGEGVAHELLVGALLAARDQLRVDDEVHHLLQAQQDDEVRAGQARDEVHLRGRGFRRGDLEQGLLQLLPQGQLGGGLPLGGGLLLLLLPLGGGCHVLGGGLDVVLAVPGHHVRHVATVTLLTGHEVAVHTVVLGHRLVVVAHLGGHVDEGRGTVARSPVLQLSAPVGMGQRLLRVVVAVVARLGQLGGRSPLLTANQRGWGPWMLDGTALRPVQTTVLHLVRQLTLTQLLQQDEFGLLVPQLALKSLYDLSSQFDLLGSYLVNNVLHHPPRILVRLVREGDDVGLGFSRHARGVSAAVLVFFLVVAILFFTVRPGFGGRYVVTTV